MSGHLTCTATLSMSRHMSTLNCLRPADTCLPRMRTVFTGWSVPAITNSANKYHVFGSHFNPKSLAARTLRSRDGTLFVSYCCLFVCLLPSLHSVRFGQMLRCAHTRIVNIMKLYIESNNIQVELIRFRKKNIDFIHVCEARGFPNHCKFTAYSLDGSNWPRTN